jgi:membrane protein DedA with SNARE-associated domain/rhodanese-related sulfurtransferase
MQYLVGSLEHHVVLVVFFNLLLAQGGLPLPAIPTLLTAAALAGRNPSQIASIVAAGAIGALLGDLAPYIYGHRYGRRVLTLLCRVSFAPDFCVNRTETVFAKVGPWTLLLAKFIPGISLVAVAMAGITRMPVPVFLAVDGLGKLLFVSTAVALGVIFQNAITSVLATLGELGEFGVAFIIVALVLYVAAKWWRRRMFIRQLRMDRIDVDELRELMDEGRALVILDVRPKEIRALDGIIPGAIGAHREDAALADYPRDGEIVVYCDCPNETSAAIAAKHLKEAGFKRIRPLLGGIDAWINAGNPLQRIEEPKDPASALVGASGALPPAQPGTQAVPALTAEGRQD